MTHMLPQRAPRRLPGDGFWRKTWAMLIKEFIQLRRDRVSFAMIIMIPLHAAHAVRLRHQHQSAPSADRRAVAGAQRSRPLDPRRACRTPNISRSPSCRTAKPRSTELLASGKVLFAVEIPANFERAVRRGDEPAMLVIADATDPVAAGSALGALGQLVQTALAHDRAIPAGAAPPFEIRTHARYNPAGATQLNIVPGLVGTILTMTMLIFTALSVTREIERGTMENLLSMPITPVEIMLGKIIPYVFVGFVQAALIIGIGVSAVRRADRRQPAAAGGVVDAVHRHQSVDRLHLLDRGAEPVAGDADVDDVLPAQHPAVRLHVSVRRHAGLGAMDRRGAAAHALSAHRALDHAQGLGPHGLRYDAAALLVLMLIAMTIAVTRFRRTLD